MQLELIGCTSAGKSTLAMQIATVARQQGVNLVLGDEFALNQSGLTKIQVPWLRAIAIHIVAFWGCLIGGWRHVGYIRFAYCELTYSKIPWHQRWNQFRKVLKQLGRYEFIRSRQRHQASVLVDEGTIHAAHNLFVHVDSGVHANRVKQFAEIVPLPDVVIYVRESEDRLVQRIVQRGHARISEPTLHSVSNFTHCAVQTFEQLSQHERIATRTMVIQNGEILSEPSCLARPELRPVLNVLRSAIHSVPMSQTNIHLETILPVHCQST